MNSSKGAASPGGSSPGTRNPATVQHTEGFLIRKLRRLPNWGLFLLIAVLYTVVLLGMDYFTGEILEPGRIAFTAVTGIALSAFILWFTKWQRARERRKPAGWPTATNFRTALSSGELPEGARAEQWLPELLKAIRHERLMAWLGMLVFIGFAGLGVFLIIDNPDHPWFWVAATVFFTVVAAWYPIWTPRRRKKMQNLIAQLPDQEA